MAGRGRGRGRGRGASTAGRDQFNAAFAGMSKEDSRAVLESFSKPVKGSGMLYPPLDKAAELPGPTPLEERVVVHGNNMLRDLAEGPEDAAGVRHGAPWRLESARKVVGIEIESYSDRYRKPAATAGPSGTSTLDAAVLHLHANLFPPALWTEYFDGNLNSAKRARAHARAQKRKRVLEGAEDDDADAAGEEEPSEEEQDDDFDFGDEEDEDHQDYDANYFDNGEGDDDSGGEGGEDDGGRYDD